MAARLLEQLCTGLEMAGLGARRLALALYRVDNSTACVRIGTSRPCREARQLARLLAEKLQEIDPGFGVERAILAAEVVEPLLPEPLAWRGLGAGDLDQARDLAPLVDRLSNRLGKRAVAQLVPQASHLPGAPSPASRRSLRSSPSRSPCAGCRARRRRGRSACSPGRSRSRRSPRCPTSRRCCSAGARRCTGSRGCAAPSVWRPNGGARRKPIPPF